MTIRFEVPTKGCCSLMNSIEDVFEAEQMGIEHDDEHETATITAILPEKYSSTFGEWATIRGFILHEIPMTDEEVEAADAGYDSLPGAAEDRRTSEAAHAKKICPVCGFAKCCHKENL